MDQAFAAPLAGATKLSAACKATQSATPAAHRSRVERDRSLNGIIYHKMDLYGISRYEVYMANGHTSFSTSNVSSGLCWSLKSSFAL